MANRKRTKGQTPILKTLHSKVKIEQHEYNFLEKNSQLVPSTAISGHSSATTSVFLYVVYL
jgi:hypothetical protein